MVTFAEIETELEKAGASHELSRSVARALELSQRKTASEVETNLKEWMENRFVSKEEFQKGLGDMRQEMERLSAESMKWMFIFWSSQLVAIAGLLFGFVKVMRP